jgi:hypothetical protein
MRHLYGHRVLHEHYPETRRVVSEVKQNVVLVGAGRPDTKGVRLQCVPAVPDQVGVTHTDI